MKKFGNVLWGIVLIGIGLIIGRYNLIKLLDSKMTVVNAAENIRRIIELSNIKLECVRYEQ